MYEIIWMPEAQQEYYYNLEYWICHNQSNEFSLKIIDSVEEMENLLSYNPNIGKPTNSEHSILKVIILKHFYMYYKMVEHTVNIVAFKSVDEDHKKHVFGI